MSLASESEFFASNWAAGTGVAPVWTVPGQANRQYSRGPDDLDMGIDIITGGTLKHSFVMGPVRISYVSQVFTAGVPVGNKYHGAFSVDFYYRPTGAFTFPAFPPAHYSEMVRWQGELVELISVWCRTQAILTPLTRIGSYHIITDYYLEEIELPKVIDADTMSIVRAWIGIVYEEKF